MKRIVMSVMLVFSLQSPAATIEGVDFPDTKKVVDKDLILNGTGLRKVSKFGIPIKVYVGGLYLPAKAKEWSLVQSSKGPKALDLQFVFRVGKDDIEKAFREGYMKNCGPTCEATKPQLLEFLKLQSDLLKGSRIEMVFLDDKVEVNIKARKDAKGTIVGADFSKNLLALFIGENPPTPEFKKGLLGN